MLDIKTTAVEEFFKSAKYISLQIASRSVIAEELEKYDKGLISIEELDSFTLPKMEDAVIRAKDVAGVWRLDAKGRPVVRIGAAIGHGPPVESGPGGGMLSGPFIIGDESFLCARVPIVNKKSEKIGTDIVLFKLTDLGAIVSDRHNGGTGGEFFLGASDGEGVRFIFPPRNEGQNPEDRPRAASIGLLLQKTFQHKSGVREALSPLGRPGIVAYRPLRDVPWGIAVWKSKEAVYGSTNRNIVLVCCSILVVIVIGTLGMLLILHPLVGKLIIHSEDLENEVNLKTAELAQELAERKRAEAALRESEQRYRTILQAAMDGYVLLDMAGRLIEVNDSYCQMSGYSAEELLKMHASQLDADHSAKRIAAHGRWMMKQGETRFEARHLRKDGAIYDVEVSLQHRPTEGGQLVCFLRDISKRKKAEKAVQRLGAAIEQAAEVIVITDPEGNIEYVNPAFERLTGYGRAEALGQNPRILKSGAQDDAFYRDLWLTISNGSTWRGHLVNKRKDGALFTENATISPVRDRAGNIVNYVAAKRDISEEVRLQEQLLQAQKMESIGRLAGGVAHDFNNMLGVIIGHAELALQDVDSTHPVTSSLEEIQTAANRSANLVRQLLAFARKQTIVPRVLDINEAVQSMLKMVRRLIGENIELIWRPGSGVWPVMTDPTQIDHILANLCVNARDAIAGVGNISIETGNKVIDENFCKTHLEAIPGEYVLLSVRDDGCGIGKENLGKLFDPFFTTKEVGKGTGLGLSTVYGTIRQNSGFMTVESELGQGTTFGIYLPRTSSPSAREAAVPQTSVPRPPAGSGLGGGCAAGPRIYQGEN